jgi:NADPH:quinone reductase-like Zn-dependent oxidoreductase
MAMRELSAGAVQVLGYREDPQTFGATVRKLTGSDGVGKTTFDASLASLAVRGTLALFRASSGPVPPLDPQRLNAAGSVYLTRVRMADRSPVRRDGCASSRSVSAGGTHWRSPHRLTAI